MLKHDGYVLLGILGLFILVFAGVSYWVTEYRQLALTLVGQYVAAVLTAIIPRKGKGA